MKDLQILLAAMKYHWRRLKNLFKEPEWKHDEQSNYYIDGDKKTCNGCYITERIILGKRRDFIEVR